MFSFDIFYVCMQTQMSQRRNTENSKATLLNCVLLRCYLCRVWATFAESHVKGVKGRLRSRIEI